MLRGRRKRGNLATKNGFSDRIFEVNQTITYLHRYHSHNPSEIQQELAKLRPDEFWRREEERVTVPQEWGNQALAVLFQYAKETIRTSEPGYELLIGYIRQDRAGEGEWSRGWIRTVCILDGKFAVGSMI